MSYLVQVDFPFNGPFGYEMTPAFAELAESINNEPGFIMKLWTENEHTSEAGGIYLFDSEEHASQYVNMHTERLKSFGIHTVHAKIFKVNRSLSLINHAPIN